MKKSILIKFGDIWLKGENKKEFKKLLEKNIREALCDFEFKLKFHYDFAELSDYKNVCEKKIFEILENIPGIGFINISYSCENELKTIVTNILNLLHAKNKTFKLEVKRKFKHFNSSKEIIAFVAGSILQNTNLKVDVHHPDVLIKISVEKNVTRISFGKTKGVSGLPIGINGSCLSLISGGIDSPVASFLMQSKGLEVNYITFITNSVNEDLVIDKIFKLINKITMNSRIFKPKFFVVDFSSIQQELAHSPSENYRITMMRRSFFRIASQVAKVEKMDALITGESIGQVASQTMESLVTIDNVRNNQLIFRPLISFTKNEIIKVAKKIKTYDLSTCDVGDVCSAFTPRSPITRPKASKAEHLEKELELLLELEKRAIQKMRVINF